MVWHDLGLNPGLADYWRTLYFLDQWAGTKRTQAWNIKLTVVESDPKALFSIATTLRCRGGCYSFPWIAPLYPWYVPYNAECWCIQNLFKEYNVFPLKNFISYQSIFPHSYLILFISNYWKHFITHHYQYQFASLWPLIFTQITILDQLPSQLGL